MSKPAAIFGKRLRAARLRAELPQDRLGVIIGIEESASSARISRYETGEHEPKYTTAQRIAKALKIPVAYLYCDNDALAELLLEAADLNKSQLSALLSEAKDLNSKS